MTTGTSGGASKRRPWPFTRHERAFIENYLAEGYSVSAVAEALGRPHQSITYFCNANGIEYVRHRRGVRTPRIFNGRRPSVSPAELQAMVSAARRTSTLAGTAREVGMPEQYVEKALQHHAPVIWHTYIRRSGLDPGTLFDVVAADWQKREASLREQYGLETQADWDAFVRDHGYDKARGWVEELERERQALARIRATLRTSLDRVDAT